MINGKSVLAIITARGGSKEVPGKNIKDLEGKPLIAWTIEAARRSKYVDRILVTTDSPKIIRVAVEAGAEAPFQRPAELSGDLAKQEDAISHAMDWVENDEHKYDYVMILTPTHPLRSEEEMDAVCEELDGRPEARGILTLMKANSHPLFANTLPEDGCLANFVPEELKLKNRQELPDYYQISGSTVLCEWDYFREEGSLLGDRTYAHVTDAVTGHDINTRLDFLVAETLMRDRLGKT
jgi:N-acylneuraminate cytidylyltransferase/CMP-N,N'-diacetyllegionaminic acid synthase